MVWRVRFSVKQTFRTESFSPVSRDFGLARVVKLVHAYASFLFQSREPGFWFGESFPVIDLPVDVKVSVP